jgi:hypothetical protein
VRDFCQSQTSLMPRAAEDDFCIGVRTSARSNHACCLAGPYFSVAATVPNVPRKLCPGEKMRTGATCSTCSQPTVATSFEGTKLWRLRFFGGAFLLASVIFREPDRARRLAGQSPLPKTRMCNASYSPQLSDFLQPYIIVQRLWQPNRSI